MKEKNKKFAFVFSDLHCSGKYLQLICDYVSADSNFCAVIFAGDIVNMGEPVWFAEKFIESINRLNLPFLWVPGNNDFGRSYYKVNAAFKSLEGRIVECCGRKFSGVGGSPASWAGQYAGESMVNQKDIAGSIFISHVPPPGMLNLVNYDIDEKRLPNNSSARKFSNAPLVHISGHLHYRWGTTYLGQTKVVQIPSAETGHYVIMNLHDLSVAFKRF